MTAELEAGEDPRVADGGDGIRPAAPSGNPLDDPAAFGIRRALAVVAHPDDESFGLGAVLGVLVARGVDVHVLCLSHGEASTLGAGVDDLGRVRGEEMREASGRLGLAGFTLLDYPDGALASVPAERLDDEVGRLAAGADLVVAFEAGGVTGHPDHVAATAAAARASARAGLPLLEWGVAPHVAATLNAELGTRFTSFEPGEDPLSLQVDRSRQLEAIACHRSQQRDNPVLVRRLELLGGCESVLWRRACRPVAAVPDALA